MKVNYDRDADAVYMNFVHPDEILTFDHIYSCDPRTMGGLVNFNIDITGRIMGIEFLSASTVFPAAYLDELRESSAPTG